MDDVEAKLVREGVPKFAGMPPGCLDADKDFAVLKREHVSRARLMHEFSMYRGHAPIRDEPDENFMQSPQVRVLLFV